MCLALQREFEKKVNPNDKQQAALLEEMRSHIKKVCPRTCQRLWPHMTAGTKQVRLEVYAFPPAARGDEEE